MTPEQRDILERMAGYAEACAVSSDKRGDERGVIWHRSRADALRAALASCETCMHADPDSPSRRDAVYCTRPCVEWHGQLMPRVGRCAEWEAS